MDISKLRIDPRSLGQNLMLVDVSPYYKYENHQRTDTVMGYKYTVACPELQLEKVAVKIEGTAKMSMPKEGFPIVGFNNLELKPYYMNGAIQITASADDVKVIKASD